MCSLKNDVSLEREHCQMVPGPYTDNYKAMTIPGELLVRRS